MFMLNAVRIIDLAETTGIENVRGSVGGKCDCQDDVVALISILLLELLYCGSLQADLAH